MARNRSYAACVAHLNHRSDVHIRHVTIAHLNHRSDVHIRHMTMIEHPHAKNRPRLLSIVTTRWEGGRGGGGDEPRAEAGAQG